MGLENGWMDSELLWGQKCLQSRVQNCQIVLMLHSFTLKFVQDFLKSLFFQAKTLKWMESIAKISKQDESEVNPYQGCCGQPSFCWMRAEFTMSRSPVCFRPHTNPWRDTNQSMKHVFVLWEEAGFSPQILILLNCAGINMNMIVSKCRIKRQLPLSKQIQITKFGIKKMLKLMWSQGLIQSFQIHVIFWFL